MIDATQDAPIALARLYAVRRRFGNAKSEWSKAFLYRLMKQLRRQARVF